MSNRRDRAPYQGRPLARPDDDLVDQGLQFDIGTLFSRRRVFGLAGVGAVGLALAGCTSGTASSTSPTATVSGGLTEIPDETNGPYPGDGSNGPDILEQSGVVRSDITTSFGTSTTRAPGVPMTLSLTVLDIASGGGGFAGAAVYVWQCDRDGRYSMYSEGVQNENYLRGVQVADAGGRVTFTSIFPACYSGRWPHVHFEVYPNQAGIADANNRVCTSQVAFPKSVCDTVYATDGYQGSVSTFGQITLAGDNVFGDDGGLRQMATVTGDVSSGYRVALTVPVDTSTVPTGGSAPGGSTPGGAPPWGGRPPSGGRRPSGGPPTSAMPSPSR